MVNFDELKGAFRNKRVLITGSTGFKGSWLSLLLLHLEADVYGYALEPERENDNFTKVNLHHHIHQQIGDIRDRDAFSKFAKECNPDYMFHLAAQPLVLEGYNNPRETFEVNTMGTVNFFETVRALTNVRAVVNITTDKCYQNNEWVWGYRENDPMGGDDPYSASKGCSELITHSYARSFFSKSSCAIASARAGNVIGGGDWAPNRIIPDVFRALQKKEAITLRYPNATRPWQFVLEPLIGYLQLGKMLGENKQDYSGGWNFGPNDHAAQTVNELVCSVLEAIGHTDYPVDIHNSHLHEANFLKLDISKAKMLLGWEPVLNFRETVQYTVRGYMDELEEKNLFYSRMEQIESFAKHSNSK